jgi:TRAP-type C4-dicarboxylate transport system substrate-binding protein
VFDGDIGKEMYKRVEDKMDLHVLGAAYLGTRQLNLRTEKEIKVPADLAGVKLRMPTTDTWQFLGKALGANPLPLAFGEIYTGLQTGVIDGQENPLPTDKAAKFYEVTQQIVLTSHLVDVLFLTIAKKAWDSYTPEQRKAIDTAIAVAVKFNDENRIKDEAELLAFFKSQGLKVYAPDQEAFRKHVQEEYLKSDYAKVWPTGLLERINTVK